MKHLISMKQLSNPQIKYLFETAKAIENKDLPWQADGLYAANLFLEPSTRTKSSFYMAERKLGIEVLHLDGQDSSITKGESVCDTVKTLEALGVDLAVIRQSETGLLNEISEDTNISLVNAGDGTGEHPTQSLLDLYTIAEEFEEFEGLHVAIAGDIKHSRVARSNAHTLRQLGAKVSFVTKSEWQDLSISDNYITMDEAVEQCDVLMLLRIQHERHHQKCHTSTYLTEHGLTKERESRMKDHAIILHPAPVNRGVEIDADIIESDKSRIFRQMTNGVAVRTAVIQLLLKGEL